MFGHHSRELTQKTAYGLATAIIPADAMRGIPRFRSSPPLRR